MKKLILLICIIVLYACKEDVINPQDIENSPAFESVTKVSLMDSLKHADSLTLDLYDDGVHLRHIHLSVNDVGDGDNYTSIRGRAKFLKYADNTPVDTAYSMSYKNADPGVAGSIEFELDLWDINYADYIFYMNTNKIDYTPDYKVSAFYGIAFVYKQNMKDYIGDADSAYFKVFNKN